MRKVLLTMMVFGFFGWVNGQISTFPYNEDFESFNTCNTTCGNACALSLGWVNPTGVDNIDWTVDEGGTPSGATGPSVDHNPGTSTGNYLYIETSGSCSGGSVAHLVSPYFDLTGIEVSVEFWYHMFGAAQGTMHLDVDTTAGTGAWVTDVVPPWTDNIDLWQKKEAVLCGFGNRDSVRFRIRGITGTSFTSDMAVDDVTVTPLPNVDLNVAFLRSPSGAGCGLGNENVEVCVINTGSATILTGTMIPLNYTVNGGTAIAESLMVSAPFVTCDTLCYTFNTQVSLSTPGIYDIAVYNTYFPDSTPVNDTARVSVNSIPTISTFPYIQDFESGSGGWAESGANSSWQFGTPGATFINAAASGVNAWVTNLLGNYNNNENSFLESPCLDFSSLTADPFIQFSHIFETENNFDETWVEVSTDAGLNWTKVGTAGSGINWYNDVTNNWWENTSGQPGNWRTARNTLTGTSGQANVKLRFVFSSDGSVTREGVGIDDIGIFNDLTDMQVVSLDTPQTRCGLSSTETVRATFINFGTSTIDTVQFCYAINNGTPVCDQLTNANIAPGATYVHTFTQTGDFSTPGTNYTVTVYNAVNGEQVPSNDTANFVVQHIPLVASLPYFEDFESGNGFWSGGGQNSTWEWGTPSAPIISGTRGACGGNNVWVTNAAGLYNNNEESFAQSPCFDLSAYSGLITIRFDHNFDSETNWDEGWLEYSTNGGVNWIKIGLFGQGINWYNDAANNWWEGSSGGWRTAEITASGIAGNSDVRFRFYFSSDGSVQREGFAFDNILIFKDLRDATAIGMTAPVSDCGLTGAETVTGLFQNTGTDTIVNPTVCFSVDGGTPVCEVVTATLFPGDTLTHTFTGTANMANFGDYDIRVFPQVAGDSLNCSDTLLTVVSNIFQVSNFPYVERFENGSGGWTPEGTNITWIRGLPAKTAIVGAASGVNCWVNGGLTGDYSNGEDNAMVGPCFDFSTTTMTNPWVAVNINYEIETGWDGANLQVSVDSGSTWSNVGAFLAPNNWYNDNDINAQPGGSLIGWSGDQGSGSNGWVSAKHPLDTALLGNPYVLFRIAFASDGVVTSEGFAFDDFAIGEPPVVALGNDTTVCGGYMLNSGYAVGTFEWSTGDTTPMITLNNTGTTARTDTIRIAYTDTFGLCGFDTVVINVQPAPAFDLGADTTICFDGTLMLDAGPSGMYNWSTGDTSQTVTIGTAGVYAVTVTDMNSGCSNVDSITVSQTSAVSLRSDTTICSGDSVMLMANVAGANYFWSTGDTTQSITVSSGGAYSVVVSDAFNCESRDTVNISLIPDPVASFNFTVAGDGVTYDFTDLSTGNPVSWSWDFGDGNTSTTQNPTHTYGTDGAYTVTLVVTNSCTSDTFTQAVTVVGLSSELGEGTVAIYPNPNRGDFEIAFRDLQANEVRVEIHNVFGQQVWSRDLGEVNSSSAEKLQLSGMAKGMYFVRIEADGKMLIKKVVVE